MHEKNLSNAFNITLPDNIIDKLLELSKSEGVTTENQIIRIIEHYFKIT